MEIILVTVFMGFFRYSEMKKFLTAILFAPVLAFAAGPTLHLDRAGQGQ
jgi:hypothetical protein